MSCRMQESSHCCDSDNLSLNLFWSPARRGSLARKARAYKLCPILRMILLLFASGNFAEWKGERGLFITNARYFIAPLDFLRDDGSAHSAPSLEWDLF